MSETVEMLINGRFIRVASGATVATALLNVGELGFRVSPGGDARAPLCGMGICQECRVTIDDNSHQRACMMPVRAGMRVVTGDPS